MDVSVIGCGRWGTLITWYLDRKGLNMTLYGRKTSQKMQQLISTKRNDLLTVRDTVRLTTDLGVALKSDIIIISISSQSLRTLCEEIKKCDYENKTFVLCLKGIEISSGMRLTEVVSDVLGNNIKTAVWLGPGHVQEFYHGIPNCMVIDSDDSKIKRQLVELFSSDLIRFYYGQDLIGNELGAALKNVIGIAAGMLDGLGLSSLKGALMSRSTHEVARFIEALGGDGISAYGLCHLGDYEATVFSKYSHNRKFGEEFIKGNRFDQLAEGYYTADAVMKIAKEKGIDMPICEAVYRLLYDKADPTDVFNSLFSRSIKKEFEE